MFGDEFDDLLNPRGPGVFGYARAGGAEDDLAEVQAQSIEAAAAQHYPEGSSWASSAIVVGE